MRFYKYLNESKDEVRFYEVKQPRGEWCATGTSFTATMDEVELEGTFGIVNTEEDHSRTQVKIYKYKNIYCATEDDLADAFVNVGF